MAQQLTVDSATQTDSKPKKKPNPILLVAVLAVVGAVIWRVFFAGPSVPPSTVILSGRIEGDDSAVAPKTAGRVLEVRVREGDQVNAGDVIAVLDDQQVQDRHDQAQADLTAAEAGLTQQEASLKLALFDKDAYTRLVQTGAVSERQGRVSVSTADQQEAAVTAANRRVEAARGALTTAKANLANPEIRASQVAGVRH